VKKRKFQEKRELLARRMGRDIQKSAEVEAKKEAFSSKNR
jgi:hypothetical protein